MGSTGSKLVKKIVSPFSSSPVTDSTGGYSVPVKSEINQKPNERISTTPVILKRQGSMFFDEDGDLAHEFYVEVPPKQGSKAKMEKVNKNLVPQGEVLYASPRLSADYPIILYQD